MISLILTLALFGVIVWMLTTYLPMPAQIKQLIVIVAVVCIVLWLLNVIGFSDIPVPRFR